MLLPNGKIMKFTKMHGTGNDYVYVNEFHQGPTPNAAELARKVSHRHFGIGADGLILIRPVAGYDAEMVMYNADGSTSEMCGNGLRCVAKFVYDHGIARREHLNLLTGAGLRQAEIMPGKDGLAAAVRLNMGTPILDAHKIPTTWENSPVVLQTISVLDREFSCTCVSMGNPHCIIFVDDVASFPVEKYGSVLEVHQRFPKRVNVEFVQIISSREVIQRTWERGSGETWACGTGASAVCVAGVLTGKTDSRLVVRLLGGNLELDFSDGQNVYMTGPAVEVFSGEFTVI